MQVGLSFNKNPDLYNYQAALKIMKMVSKLSKILININVQCQNIFFL